MTLADHTIDSDLDDADAMMATAHASAYRLPAGFAGFSARVRATTSDGHASGTVVIASPDEIVVVLHGSTEDKGASSDPIKAWVSKELASMVAHRWHQPYALADGRWPKTIDADTGHPLGRVIRLVGDPFSSSYRVLDGQVTQVDRTMGAVRFVIAIHSRSISPDGRSLPGVFTASHWHTGSRRLVRSDAFVDTFATIGHSSEQAIVLPGGRRVVSADDAGLATRVLELTEHQLLSAPS